MKYLRYLRIAFSIGCGLACVLMLVLWVRSQRKLNHISIGIGTHVLSFDSNGPLLIMSVRPARPRWQPDSLFLKHTYPTFKIRQGPTGGFVIQIRHWIVAITTGLVAVLPRVPWFKQFSLRTLLIAITLVAVGLGVLVSVMT